MLRTAVAVFCIAILTTHAQAGVLHLVTIDYSQDQFLISSTVDEHTGQRGPKNLIALPPTLCENGTWELPIAAEGFTSNNAATSFWTNSTMILAVTQKCTTGDDQLAILTFMPFNGSTARLLGTFDTAPRLSTVQISWDYACNVIVTFPSDPHGANVTAIELSLYDGAERPLPTYNTSVDTPLYTPLGGGLAAQNLWGNELNCGDNCRVYSVDASNLLVGHSVMHGTIDYNQTIPAEITLLSLAYLTSSQQSLEDMYFGTARCAGAGGSGPCPGLVSEGLVMFQFNQTANEAPKPVMFVSQTHSQEEDLLGLAVDRGYTQDSPRMSALVDGHVLTFAPEKDAQGQVQLNLKSNSTQSVSHGDQEHFVMWAYLSQ